MKKTIIANNFYRGIRTSNRQPNELTKTFYLAKFFKESSAIKQLVKLAKRELKKVIDGKQFDYITAVNNVISKWNLPKVIAKQLSKDFGIPYLDIFKDANQHLNVDKEKIKGKKILVIDDVIYSGSTIRRAAYLLRTAKAEEAVFYALLKSRSFKS